MSSVDNRIVQMQFDNKQFESGIKTSTKSLDDLKKGLNLDESARSLSNLERAGRSFSLAGIAAGVENLTNKFSTLGIIGMTALQNITNSAINAGKQFVSSLTIDPIKMGFEEYETKMNAIQTILTNTQGGQRKVTQQALSATKESSAAAANAIRDANEEALKDLRKANDVKRKDFEKLADEELDIFEKKHQDELDMVTDFHERQSTEIKKSAERELDALEDKYQKQSEALQKSIDDENNRVRKAHDERLDLYEEEYMGKLKVIDEEKYNKIKAIDAQIKSFKDLTKSENDARDKEEQKNRLAELQKKVDTATNAQDRMTAEKALAEYKDRLYREQVLKEREAKIETLNASKKTIEDNYTLVKEQLKKEYDQKKESENENYKTQTAKLKEQQSEKINAIKTAYENEKELALQTQGIIKDFIKDQQREKMESIKKTYQAEKELIVDRQQAEKDALKEIQEEEIDALNKRNRIAIANIEDQKNAQSQVSTVIGEGEVTKGSSLDDVNAALEELNDYADKTIYNFAQMTDNVGKFTAAGLGLNDSVTTVKGLANVAAGFGVDATKMAGATYQMSQALAAGVVKLQDWNSLQQAGMSGPKLQDALVATAKEMGVFVDAGIPFRESLEKGWLTTDIFVKTMAKMANDPSLLAAAQNVTTFTKLLGVMRESVQSGWAKSWELILGNSEESTKLWTSMSDAFGAVSKASADARNNTLAFWKDNGGRAAIIEALTNSFNALQAILKPVTEAFREVFPPITGQQLVDFSKAVRDLTAGFKMGDETANNLKSTFKGLFSIIDIGIKAVMLIADALGVVLKAVFPVTGGILSITSVIGDWISGLNSAIEENNAFGKAIGFVGDAISVAMSSLSSGFDGVKSFVLSYMDTVHEAINVSINFFSELIAGIKDVFVKLVEEIQNVFDKTREVTTGFSDVDLSGTTAFSEKLSGAFSNLSEAGSKVTESFKWIGDILEKFKQVLLNVGDTINRIFGPSIDFLLQKLREITLSDIGAFLAGGGFFMIGKALKDNLGSVKDIAGGFSSVLDGITGSLEAFQTKLKAEALLKIAIAIGVLAASIIALSMIDPESLNKALIALTVVFTELSAALLILQKSTFSATGVSGSLLSLGVAVLLISFAMKTLSEVDQAKLLQGVEGLSAILTLLAIFSKVTSSAATMQTSMAGIIGISLAVLILAEAVEKFANLDPNTMDQGIKGLTVSLMGLALFIKMVGSPESMIALGVGITAIALAMNIFARAVALMGAIPDDAFKKGLTGVATALTAIALATNRMPDNASMIAMGVGMNLMAVALYAIAGAVAIFGNMELPTLAFGIGALAASLFIMAEVAKRMNGSLAGAGALTAMAFAINLLAPAIAILGNLELTTIGIALLALAGVFTVLGLSALILSRLSTTILTLSVSVGILGIGVYAVGAGLVLFAAGLAALAAGGAVFIMAIVKLIPEILGLVKTIAEGLIRVFTELLPPLVEAALKFVLVLIQKLAEYVPQIVVAGYKLMKGLLKGIADNIEEVVSLAIDVVLNFLKGVLLKLPDIIQVGTDVIVAFMEGMGKQQKRLADAGFKLMIDFINGLADAIRNNTPKLLEAFVNLSSAIIEGLTMGLFAGVKAVLSAIRDVAMAIINGFKELLGIHSPSTVFEEFGVNTLLGFINGLNSKISDLAYLVADIISELLNGISSKVSDFVDVGKSVIDGFITGLKSKISEAASWTTNLANSVLDSAKKALGINSPSKEFAKIGMYANEGLAEGLDKFSGLAEMASENVGNTAIKSLSDVISNIADVVSGDIDLSPTIRPVLDLSNVQTGNKELTSMFNNQTITANARAVELVGSIGNRSAQTQTITSTPKGSNEPGTIQNTFSIASLVVREEADVKKVARQLYQFQLAGSRG